MGRLHLLQGQSWYIALQCPNAFMQLQCFEISISLLFLGDAWNPRTRRGFDETVLSSVDVMLELALV